jgi:predicted acetyltransferase
MELYIHDLSAMFPHVKLGTDGRFGYPALPSYLSGENGRRAFVIRHEGGVAGFVLAQRGSPASDDPSVLDVAEFFVLRQFRAKGVGRAAATQLWSCMPGRWTIRASSANPAAVRFWRDVVLKYAGERATESERSIGAARWVVLCFDNSPEASPQS